MTTPDLPTELEPQRRGDPFSYSSSLTGDWLVAMFPGGFKFTLRTSLPASSQTDDSDTFATGGGVVDQATSGAGEITFSDAVTFSVTLPSTRTKSWPVRTLFWDISATIDASRSYVLDWGTIQIVSDVGRGR